MDTISTTWPGADVVRPGIPRPAAMERATMEYARILEAAERLAPEEWELPTVNAEWNVREMISHVAAMATFGTGFREMLRQTWMAKSRQQPGQLLIDAQTSWQVDVRRDWASAQILAEIRDTAPRAVRFRTGVPEVLRRKVTAKQQINGRQESWSLGFLIDVILTRDPWTHRMDLSRATGRPPVLTPEHDGVIVADVVAEWARRHGQPFTLELTGPAGGRWTEGHGGEEIAMDAIAFCQVLSGRPTPDGSAPTGLLRVQLPF